MEYFFATFGSGHPIPMDKVVCIRAHDESLARDYMFDCFGMKWAFMYEWRDPRSGFNRQVAEFGYTPLICVEVARVGHDGVLQKREIDTTQFMLDEQLHSNDAVRVKRF